MRFAVVAIVLILVGNLAVARSNTTDTLLEQCFNNGTSVPIGELGRWLGADVKLVQAEYEQIDGHKSMTKSAHIILRKSGKTVEIGVGHLSLPKVTINGKSQDYFVRSQIVSGTVYVEASALAKAFGMSLRFKPAESQIIVSAGSAIESAFGYSGPKPIITPTRAGGKSEILAQGWRVYSPNGLFVIQDYRTDDPENGRAFGIFSQQTGWLISGGWSADQVKAIAWHPDSRRYAIMHDDSRGGEAVILSAISKGEVGAYRTKGRYQSIAFSPDGKFLLFGKERINLIKDSTLPK